MSFMSWGAVASSGGGALVFTAPVNTDDHGDGTDFSSKTLTGINIGAAPTGSNVRVVIVAITTKEQGGNPTVTSVDFNGTIFLTEVVGTIDGANSCYAGIWAAIVPTGTTATLNFTTSGTATGYRVTVYATYNPAATVPGASYKSSDNTPSSGVLNFSLNIPTGAKAIAVVQQKNGGTVSWSSMTTVGTDLDIEGTEYASAAIGGSAGTPHSEDATSSDSTPGVMVGVAACWYG